MNIKQPLMNYTFVAFDTETSGAYPVGFDVVEFGAVKWQNGQEVDRLQFLLKPREKMSDFIIGIHGITNEMVQDAPKMSEKIREIYNFFKDTVLIAHHAPFDLGFLAVEFEKYGVSFPTEPVLCSSLLSRKIITESANHKLQTLVKLLKLDGGSAHRAADDASACLQVALECFKRMGTTATLEDAIKMQAKPLQWANFSVLLNKQPIFQTLVAGIENRQIVEISYDKTESKKGEIRQIAPIGIVRNPDGDYVMAKCLRDGENKRFYISKILDASLKF